MTRARERRADPKVFAAAPRRHAPTPPGRVLTAGLMGLAGLIAVAQAAWFLVDRPPSPGAPARPFEPDPRGRLEIALTPDQLRALAPEGLTWTELFQHYGLDDAHLAPTLRRNLGDGLSPDDLAASADQPVPMSRTIVLVLRE